MRGLWGEGSSPTPASTTRWPRSTGSRRQSRRSRSSIGGGGQKILSLAAQKADIVGINPKIVARSINPKSMATAAADVVDQKIGWVKEAAGDRLDDLELQLQVFVTKVTDDPVAYRREARARLRPAARGRPPGAVLPAGHRRPDRREPPGPA